MPIVNVPLILVVSPAKYRSLAELIAAGKAKARRHELRLGRVRRGRASDLERLRLAAGFEAQHIPSAVRPRR